MPSKKKRCSSRSSCFSASASHIHRAGRRVTLLSQSNERTRGSSASVIWNVLLDYLEAGAGGGESSCGDDGFRGQADTTMFLAGSGIPALAQLHIPLVLIRGQFLLTRQMWLFMSANLNPRPAPPPPTPPSSLFLFRGEILVSLILKQ